jgi:hypothetical protein
MHILASTESVIYVASTGDWRLLVRNQHFEILPQVGGWEYSSGTNLDNLATLIADAKADATARGIDWSGS